MYWCLLHPKSNTSPKIICGGIWLQQDKMTAAPKWSCKEVIILECTPQLLGTTTPFLHTSIQPATSSSLWFFPPWSSHRPLWPSLWLNSPPRSSSCLALSLPYSLLLFQQGKSWLTSGVGDISNFGSNSRVCCQSLFPITIKNRSQQKIDRALGRNFSSLNDLNSMNPPSLTFIDRLEKISYI